MISVKKLNKYFFRHRQNEIHVINNVGLELPEKGLTAIFGRSGCGKTTLLNVIGGLDGFSSGSVEYDGASISENTDYLRNSSIGYIFQNYCLSRGRTVYENVADVLRLCGEHDEKVIEYRVLKALSSVGMEKFRNRTPDMLSGGQQQRVAIARAVVKSPRVILADEPTGNLDDANTVAVMDMLRSISEKCLVLLVTHEERLVEYYCDSVIELSDGSVVSVRALEKGNGYSFRQRGNVYLGDLDVTELPGDGLNIRFYGDKPETPVELKIVSVNGRIYLQSDSPNVKYVDGTGEIRLIDGKFDQTAKERKYGEYEPLPPLPKRGKREYGRLFTFFGSFKNGFASQMNGKKKGKRFVRMCMGMFAAVIVIFAGVYGRKTADLFDIKKSVNGNLIAVRADLPGAERAMADAFENSGTSGVDYYFYAGFAGSVGEQEILNIVPAYFISGGSGVVLSAEGTPLPESLADGLRVLAGEKKISDTSIWISRYMADRFLKTSTVSFIRNYSDLVGLRAGNYDVAAVIDTSEPVYFLPDAILQELNIERLGLKIQKSSDPAAEGGKTVYMSLNDTSLKAGEPVMINGKRFEVAEVRRMYGCYADWLLEKYPEHLNLCEKLFGSGIMSEQLLAAAKDDAAFAGTYSASSEPDAEGLAYLYAYRYFDEWVGYCAENNLICRYSSVPELFYVYKAGVLDDAKYPAFGEYGWYGDDSGGKYMSESFSRFYSVLKFFRSNGRVASPGESVADYSYSIDYLVSTAEELYYKIDTSGIAAPVSESFFMLGPDDYAIASTGYGESDPLADGGLYGLRIETGTVYSSPYLVAHCSDYGKALKLITAEYGAPDRYSPDNVSPRIITPEYQFDERLADKGMSVLGGVVPFVAVVALLCVCVYFMIRSTLMNRVKDVGIYRAIGVTKNNLRFSFMAETLALTCTSVVPWFAAFSALLFLTLKRSTIAGNTIFYPPWFAALLLAFVVGICLVCGIMPINRLLRKTPAELLAKYDI